MTEELSKIEESLRRFSGYSNALLGSDYTSFGPNLNILIDFCGKNEIIGPIVSSLKLNRNVDIDQWYKDFLGTVGSFVGSGRYSLPTDLDDRLSLLYQFLMKINQGEIDLISFCTDAFGDRNFDQMVYHFNRSITNIFVRDLSDKLQLLAREVQKKIPVVSTGFISPQILEYVSGTLSRFGWDDAWRELGRAQQAYDEGRMPDCCHNLRKGLEIVWLNVYEILEKERAPSKPGTGQDIGLLVNSLRKHRVPDDLIGLIRSTWAYITERDHIEKKRGKAPPELEVILGIQLVFAVVDFLLRFVS